MLSKRNCIVLGELTPISGEVDHFVRLLRNNEVGKLGLAFFFISKRPDQYTGFVGCNDAGMDKRKSLLFQYLF